MEKLSEKKISRALQDTEFFKTLEPAEMMYVLVSDIILRGDVKKSNFEYWLTQEERWPEISAEDRMDQVLRVLEDESPSAALQAFQKVGFMRFCMPRCFPIRKLMDKKTFYSIIDNFNQLEYRLYHRQLQSAGVPKRRPGLQACAADVLLRPTGDRGNTLRRQFRPGRHQLDLQSDLFLYGVHPPEHSEKVEILRRQIRERLLFRYERLRLGHPENHQNA